MNYRSLITSWFSLICVVTGGFLFVMEGPVSVRVVRPQWYITFRHSLPGVKERDQRSRICGTIPLLKSHGHLPAVPPDVGFYRIEAADIWGTSLRIEYRDNNAVVSSAGPDKKFNTSDDRLDPY